MKYTVFSRILCRGICMYVKLCERMYACMSTCMWKPQHDLVLYLRHPVGLFTFLFNTESFLGMEFTE